MRPSAIAAAIGVALLVLAVRCPGSSELQAGVRTWSAEAPSVALEAWSLDNATLPPSGTRLYDLGVAWWHAGDDARALAYWRAARELHPRSTDLAHNLALVRAEQEGAPTPVGAAHPWMALVTPGEVGVLAFLLWLMASVRLVRWRRAGGELPVGTGATVLGALALSAVALSGREAQLHRPPGVVLEVAAGREAPALAARDRFTLPAGSEVRVQSRRGPFLLVETGDGDRGWMLADVLEVPGLHGAP